MNQRDFSIVTGPIRPGAVPIHIYNEGLVVFLYDESYAKEIKQHDPDDIAMGMGDETDEESKNNLLFSEAKILIYGLHGDGGIALEVLLGDPLTDEELATGEWFPTEIGYLQLPSGQLQIHSYNSLPMGDNGDFPDEKGGTVNVPPGNYRVQLYKKDWDKMEDQGIMNLDWAEEAGIKVYDDGRIDEVITLTPVENINTGKLTNVLFQECI